MAKIAWNDEFELLNEKGTHELKDFTGHIQFNGTDCDVEHADIRLVINRPECLDGKEPWTKQVKSLNWIEWHGGTVISGDMHCRECSNGMFSGRELFCNNANRIVFNGESLAAYGLFGCTVNSGDTDCHTATKCKMNSPGTFKCMTWECGEMSHGIFIGNWQNGYFNGGTFKGTWHGGIWKGGIWNGDSRIGDGTFHAIEKEHEN